MFLCEDCRKGNCHGLHLQSHGPCESCGRTTMTMDCNCYKKQNIGANSG